MSINGEKLVKVLLVKVFLVNVHEPKRTFEFWIPILALGLSGCSTRGMAAITRKNVLKNLKDFRPKEGPKKDAKGQEGTSRRPRGRQERPGPNDRVPGLCNI